MGSLYDKMFDKFGTKAKSSMPQVSSTMSTETSKQKTDVDSKTKDMGSAYDKMFTDIGAKAQSGMGTLSSTMSTQGQQAVTTAQNISSQVGNAFDGLSSQLERTGYNAGIGFNNGLANSSQQIYDTAQQIANNVANTMNSALQVNSPSRVMMRTGQYVDEGLIVGMKRKERNVALAAQSVADEVADSFGFDLDLDALREYSDRYLVEYRRMYDEVEMLAKEHYNRMLEYGARARDTWSGGSWSLGGFDVSGTVNSIADALTSALGGMRFAGGGGVTIVMNGTVVREDADIPRIANEVVRRIAREDAMAIGRR
jgi:hypothetical protein